MSRIYDTIFERAFNIPDDKGLYRFKKGCNAIDRINAYVVGLQLYFLTLTLSSVSADKTNKDLNKFITFLRLRFRRAGLPFWYIWVPEFQFKRYKTYGVWVLHFHFVILCLKGALPNCYYDKVNYPHIKVKTDGSLITARELFKFWSYGIVLCKYAWSKSVYGYLSKYLLKERADKIGCTGFPVLTGSRGYGSSQFGYYAYPKWCYDAILNGSVIYAHMVVLKKGSILTIKGYDKGYELIEEVKIKSPYVRLFYPY